MYRRKFLFAALIILLTSCTTSYQPASLAYAQYRIEKTLPSDSAMTALIQPYAVNINSVMNRVIGTSADNYNVSMPECEVGNFMADCFREMAEKKFGRKVDLAVMNRSGIRSYLSKGPITVGKVFELMPFDNLVVLQEVKGAVLQQFLDVTAADGGWPLSRGSSLVIRNKKAADIIINGKALDLNATYMVANSDYIANGGSNCDMLKAIPQMSMGYLMRDAMTEYITALTASGKILEPKKENRVSNGN